MNKLFTLISLALGVILISCNDDNDTIYSVSPDLDPYVSTFYSEANERGVSIETNLVAEVKGNAQSIIDVNTASGQNRLYFNQSVFNEMVVTGRTDLIELQVYHHLARLLLKKDLDYSDNYTLMNPKLVYKEFRAADPSYTHKYDPSDKESLFNELFQ